MLYNFPKYFIQNQNWSSFWLAANPIAHKVHKIKVNEQIEPVLIYQYPWQFGQNFWYLPRLFLPDNLSRAEINNYLKSLFIKIKEESKKYNPIFLKIEIDDQLSKFLELYSTKQLADYLQNNFDFKTKTDTKTIQYLQTITLDLQSLESIKTDDNFSLESLTKFYQESASFWKNTNENVRRYTKKSLSQNWKIVTEKTDITFQEFYKVYNQTKDRQNFAIQTETYLKSLFNQEFSRIIILYDDNNQPQAVWFGTISEQTLTYLYGGNTAISFEKKGQYLLHLVAVKMAVNQGLIFYDLGGYNSKLGFGKFKENYKGILRNFVGPVDIIFRPAKYATTNLIIKLGKLIFKY